MVKLTTPFCAMAAPRCAPCNAALPTAAAAPEGGATPEEAIGGYPAAANVQQKASRQNGQKISYTWSLIYVCIHNYTYVYVYIYIYM
jgi:hypothetical protein